MKSLNLVRALVLFGLFSLGLACDELTADSTIAHIFEEHIRPSLSEYLSEEEIQQVDEQYDSTLFAGLSIKTVSIFQLCSMFLCLIQHVGNLCHVFF